MLASRSARRGRPAHRLGRSAWLALGGVLCGFHGLLLAARLADASIAEPAVAARWAGSLALGALAWALSRRGVAVLSGRAGLVLALLVLLLHLGAPPPPADLAPGAALAACLPLGLAAPLAAALGAAGRARNSPALPRPAAERRPRLEPPAWLALAPALAVRHAPRPPPAA